MTTHVTTPAPTLAGGTGRRPDGGVRTSLRILAVVFSVVAVGWGAFSVVSLLARVTEHRSATYEGVRAVDLGLSFESAEIVGSADATSVSMTRSYTWSLGRPTITSNLDGGLLSMGSSCPFSVGLGCSGHVRLVVPSGLSVTVHDSDGSLTLRNLGGTVDLSTSDGSIHAKNLSGKLTLHSSDGSLTATGLTSPTVAATTSDGSVHLTFAAPPSSVTASSSDGSLDIVVPKDGTAYDVTATTGDGSRNISVPTDSSSEHKMTLRTSDGSIHVQDR
jgi:Putative adhesin